MIFYFSGTGNSLDAAKQLCTAEESLFNIAELYNEEFVDISVKDSECLGFVFPVYYGGVPSIVREFVSKLRCKTAPDYIYAVITCGANIFGAGHMLCEDLKKQGLALNIVFPVKMPDNYVVMYSIDNEEKRERILKESKTVFSELRCRISAREESKVCGSLKDRTFTAAMYPFYNLARKTARFWVDDSCIGCGRCVKRCPVGAMRMENGKPVWIKESCVHCLSCARCGAIQYGKGTVGRERYSNPILKEHPSD